MALGLPAVQSARETARGNTARNTMRMLMVAGFNYSARNGKLVPQASRDADGKPLLSWRVHLLPDLDQQALYDRFHLDEPWDSDHNKALIPLMPQIYVHPSVPVDQASGRTVFQIPRGKGTLYEGDTPPTDADIDRLPVGRGQLVAFVATAPDRAVVWTKPEDVELTPETLFDRLLVSFGREVSVAMHDGSVIVIERFQDLDTLLPMFFPRTAR
jgi:hypothetical protein